MDGDQRGQGRRETGKERLGSTMSTTKRLTTRNAKLKHEHPEVKNLRLTFQALTNGTRKILLENFLSSSGMEGKEERVSCGQHYRGVLRA